jgi:recombination protein RecR
MKLFFTKLKVLGINTNFAIMNFPSKLVENAVEQLSSLPGIGRKSALRLVLHMLKRDKLSVEQFGDAFIQLINRINYCSRCYSISDSELCEVCANPKRDAEIICVVEDIRVMMAIENTMQYKGVYHILGGLISPIDGIGPSDIRIEELIGRVSNDNAQEIIFALSTTMEGDTTNYYLFRRLKDYNIKISSIARGIAIGDELEYTDEITLGAAISSRMPYSE